MEGWRKGKKRGGNNMRRKLKLKRVGKIIHVAKIFGMYLRDLKG